MLSDGAGLTARQCATVLARAGHRVGGAVPGGAVPVPDDPARAAGARRPGPRPRSVRLAGGRPRRRRAARGRRAAPGAGAGRRSMALARDRIAGRRGAGHRGARLRRAGPRSRTRVSASARWPGAASACRGGGGDRGRRLEALRRWPGRAAGGRACRARAAGRGASLDWTQRRPLFVEQPIGTGVGGVRRAGLAGRDELRQIAADYERLGGRSGRKGRWCSSRCRPAGHGPGGLRPRRAGRVPRLPAGPRGRRGRGQPQARAGPAGGAGAHGRAGRDPGLARRAVRGRDPRAGRPAVHRHQPAAGRAGQRPGQRRRPGRGAESRWPGPAQVRLGSARSRPRRPGRGPISCCSRCSARPTRAGGGRWRGSWSRRCRTAGQYRGSREELTPGPRRPAGSAARRGHRAGHADPAGCVAALRRGQCRRVLADPGRVAADPPGRGTTARARSRPGLPVQAR